MDRTSELPSEILHQILSRLSSTKTAARTSVLSKPWLKACSTQPHLKFDESDFTRGHGQFLSIVDNTLERYLRENLPISGFKICISFSDCDSLALLDKLFDIIAEKRISQVSLLLKSRSVSERYSLSADTLFAMDWLQHLELHHCNILLFEDKIRCRNLKSLILRYVSVSGSTLDRLISCCAPHIMRVSFQYCIGFTCIRLSNLPNLLSLNILCCPIEQVHIGDAPKLLSFEYVNRDYKLNPLPISYDRDVDILTVLDIGTANCQNLTKVEFVKATIDDTALFQLIQKLPSIKELILHYCDHLENIRISSSTLEICNIADCKYLVQVIFDVPKLLSLVLSNNTERLPSLTFERPSNQSRISICGVRWYDQFIHLRKSLVELIDQAPVDLKVCSIPFRKTESSFSGIDDHDHLIPPPQVENLILSFCEYNSTAHCSAYLDAMFWICCPKSLTVQHCGNFLKKFLCEQLLKKRLWRFMCTSWEEYLINAEIDYRTRRRADWVALDRKMCAANPRIMEEIVAIRFKQNQKKGSSLHFAPLTNVSFVSLHLILLFFVLCSLIYLFLCKLI